MTQPPGPGPYDPAGPQDGSQAPYGSSAPGGPQPPTGDPAGAPYAAQPQYVAGQYPGQQYPASAYGAPPYYPKNNLAIWSLVLGIASFVLSCGFFTGIPAVIVGNAAKRAVAEGQADNDGMATAGIILGWVAIALSVIGLLSLLIFVPGILAWVGTIPDQY
ncbi:DUF4190 domain-containing protein [Cellulosimicrobium cellulans]|uniref:DUF4190 domain-containing protein n=1 Tax=Cellulosimicrobium cellulans TaxID=1710 RepID=UPI002096996C|nr:DUF4190 domain-containing protein [Cellulosimicrobium cellulans]MCO7271986.1 DUF4190 domain-containing protein [Cellulosimicrobium cellulans]